MSIVPFENAYPIEFQVGKNLASEDPSGNEQDAKVASYITSWRAQLRSSFIVRRNIWDDCWRLYRGEDDFSAKQDWQSKIVLPKAFTSVKMATNTIKRLLSAAKKPWDIESVNENDIITSLRAEQMTDLTKLFMDKAHFLKEFSEGLECAFILGLGVWKLWWGLVPRKVTRVETTMVPMRYGQSGMPVGDPLGTDKTKEMSTPFGQAPASYWQQNMAQYPTQMPGEFLNPSGFGGGGMGPSAPPDYLMIPQKQVVSEEVMEGKLFMRAVDPYNFYWLPGSKLNRWVGTIEDVEVPKWELIRMAENGIFPMEKVKAIQPMKIDERYKMSGLRFSETALVQNGPNSDTAPCKLTEFFGPLVWDGKMISEYAHVILANDTTVLLMQKNPFMHRKPPYIGFSPLNLPFRTEGVGLVEMVRYIDKALSQLANLSVDTLVFRLLPIFEVAVDALENPEDIETGLVPGKILRKNLGSAGVPAIKPIEFNDISSGTVQTWSALDRSHQEGALISDIGEGLPRWRGQQTATETTQLAQQSESFMGGMAADIEKEALEPLVTMAMDLVFQFIDTANDPRIASILGVGADVLKGMSREEISELIAGDYKVKVSGITGQLMKADMLQNLVQMMNLIGQNPQAWLPYVNESALLRRMLECFRPHIHDIEDIIADPATADAKKAAMLVQEKLPEFLQLLMESQQQQGTPPPQIDPNALLDHAVTLQTLEHNRETSKMDQQAAMASQMMDAAHTSNQSAQDHSQAMQQIAAQPKPAQGA